MLSQDSIHREVKLHAANLSVDLLDRSGTHPAGYRMRIRRLEIGVEFEIRGAGEDDGGLMVQCLPPLPHKSSPEKGVDLK